MMENNTDISCEETLKHSSSLATQHRALEPHITDTFGCKQRPIGKWLRVGDLRRTLWLRRPTTAPQSKLLNHLNQSTKKMRRASSRSVFVWIDAIHVLLHSHGKCSSLECHKLVTNDKTIQNLRPLQKLQVTWSILVGHSTAFYSIVQHPKDVSLIPWYTVIYLDSIYQYIPTVTRCGITTFALELDLCLQGRGRSCRGPVINQGSGCLPWEWLNSMQEDIHGIIQLAKVQALVSNEAVTADKHGAWILKQTNQRLRYAQVLYLYQCGFRCDLCDLWATRKGEKELKNLTLGLQFSV